MGKGEKGGREKGGRVRKRGREGGRAINGLKKHTHVHA